MSWFIIRIIAMLTMLADHIGRNFIDNQMLLTWIWRIAFPCYAFLLAEWFFFVFKEKRRLLKHIWTLIILAVISEPCYDLLEFWPDILEKFTTSQSVMITLLLWFLWMIITELLFPSNKENNEKIKRKNIAVIICSYLLIGYTNYIMAANFNFVWPLLAIAYYRYLRYARNEDKTKNNRNRIKRFLVLLWIFVVYLPLYFWIKGKFPSMTWLIEYMWQYLPWIWWYFIAAIVLSLSNGKLWYHEKWFRYLYISFYPLHALIIWILLCLGF